MVTAAPPNTTGSNRSNGSNAGLFADSAELLGSVLRYFKARAALFSIEAKEAGMHYGLAGAFVAAALVLVFLGYVFLIITAVFGIAALLGGGNAWIAVLGVAALLHLGGAFGLVLAARKKVQGGAFHITAEELSKDREWLTSFSRNH
jgi:uncharacterized membrane protein YqjE